MKYKLYILLLFISASNIFSQDKGSIILNDLKNFLVTGKDIVAAPFHFKQDDWIKFGALSTATTLGYFADDEVRSFVSKNQNDFNDVLFNMDNDFYVYAIGIAGAGLYGYGLLEDQPKIRKLALQLGEAAVYTTTLVYIFKIAAGRNRPYLNNGNNEFEPGSFKFDKTSFPSFHSSVYFAISTVMANYIDNLYWDIGWYTLATLVASSRVYNDWHWFSDVISGAAIGYFLGEFISNRSNNESRVSGSTNYFLGMNFIDQQPVYTITVNYIF